MSNKDKSKKGIIITIAVVLFLLLAFLITKTIINNNKEKINNEIDIQEVVSDKQVDENNDNENDSNSKEKELVVELEDDESYLITFALNDGTILQSTFVKKGELPVYVGAIPVIEGYKFIGWNKSIKKVSESTTYYARFEKVEEEIPPKPTVYYTITVEIKNGYEGKCADTEQKRFGSRRCAAGSVVEIYANPIEGYATVWQDGNTSNPRSIIVTKDETYTAHFETGYNLTYKDYYLDGEKTVRIKENETVNIVLKDTSSISGTKSITVNGDMNLNVDNYNIVIDTAEYTFIGYKYNNQVTPKTLIAQYKDKVTINTSVNNENYGVSYTTIDGDDYSTDKQSKFNYYDKGDDVYICAKPIDINYDFVKWSDGVTSNPRKVTATNDITYVAIFESGYDYMNFTNTSENDGIVSMHINGFDENVYHVRKLLPTDNISEETKLVIKDNCVCVDDYGNDLIRGELPEGYNQDGSKSIKLVIPELLLEYRVDKFDVSKDSYNIGFWDDFNLSEEDLTGNDVINDDNCYKKIDLGSKDRINIRAKKNNGVYTSKTVAKFTDSPLCGLEGEEYFYFDKTTNTKQVISFCIGSHLFDLLGENTEYKACGSLTSILDGKGNYYDNINTINGGNALEHGFTFAVLFNGCTKLTDISGFKLNVGNTTMGCYYALFQGTGIEKIPANFLPATELTNSCYAYMFAGSKIKSLIGNKTDGSDNFILPATKVAGRCYFSMFQNCKYLVSVPNDLVSRCTSLMNANDYASEVKKLFDGDGPDKDKIRAYYNYLMSQSKCYYSMFRGCTSLTNIPDLPAMGLQPYCYEYMFYNCTSLESKVFLPAEFLYDYCYSHMFDCINGNSNIKEIYLGANEWGVSKRVVHEGEQDPYRDYDSSLNPFTSFLGHVENGDTPKTYGVSTAEGCKMHLKVTELGIDIPSYIFVGDFINKWTIDNDYNTQPEDPPASFNEILNLEELFNEINNELIENENIVEDVIDDYPQETVIQNPEDVIENNEDVEEVNEEEITPPKQEDEIIPIEHKEDELESLDQLEA